MGIFTGSKSDRDKLTKAPLNGRFLLLLKIYYLLLLKIYSIMWFLITTKGAKQWQTQLKNK